MPVAQPSPCVRTRRKIAMKRKSRSKSALPAGVVGLTMTLAGAACAGSAAASTQSAVDTARVRTIDLSEVEVFDVALASRGDARRHTNDGRVREAYCRGCGGCWGCRGCRGCSGCRGCRA